MTAFEVFSHTLKDNHFDENIQNICKNRLLLQNDCMGTDSFEEKSISKNIMYLYFMMSLRGFYILLPPEY